MVAGLPAVRPAACAGLPSGCHSTMFIRGLENRGSARSATGAEGRHQQEHRGMSPRNLRGARAVFYNSGVYKIQPSRYPCGVYMAPNKCNIQTDSGLVLISAFWDTHETKCNQSTFNQHTLSPGLTLISPS